MYDIERDYTETEIEDQLPLAIKTDVVFCKPFNHII